ncbi:hypothetical protein CY34DRAFT_797288 [Suillus luteus UH-Slu-Lm8-n1]|uniref:Uncharacterized protein n=1 Tax=Suillus luteus UH-Slu-Lm8-n1 TaxID=930992 RepID=A0A0D0AGS3_9AGAM|nr:hypothetical protein CY34DRAFT_797288 [Suillus luteus UH-Slu-Lm8-n1]
MSIPWRLTFQVPQISELPLNCYCFGNSDTTGSRCQEHSLLRRKALVLCMRTPVKVVNHKDSESIEFGHRWTATACFE